MKRQLIGIALLVILVSVVNATNIIVTSNPAVAEVGSYRNTAGGLEVRDDGNSPAGSALNAAGTAAGCTDNIQIMTVGGNANTVVTSGNLVYSVKVLTRSSPLAPANTCFRVTAAYNGGNLTRLYIKTQSTVVAGDFAICQFDLGVTSVPATYTIKVTVEQV